MSRLGKTVWNAGKLDPLRMLFHHKRPLPNETLSMENAQLRANFESTMAIWGKRMCVNASCRYLSLHFQSLFSDYLSPSLVDDSGLLLISKLAKSKLFVFSCKSRTFKLILVSISSFMVVVSHSRGNYLFVLLPGFWLRHFACCCRFSKWIALWPLRHLSPPAVDIV